MVFNMLAITSTSNGKSVRYMAPAVGLLLIGLLVSGCATPEPTLYRWGIYEQIMYKAYGDDGSDPVNDAIELAQDMARTEAEGALVPPGARVHLGYLYFSQGNLNEARALFEKEREIFPESTAFIDGMLERMDRQ